MKEYSILESSRKLFLLNEVPLRVVQKSFVRSFKVPRRRLFFPCSLSLSYSLTLSRALAFWSALDVLFSFLSFPKIPSSYNTLNITLQFFFVLFLSLFLSLESREDAPISVRILYSIYLRFCAKLLYTPNKKMHTTTGGCVFIVCVFCVRIV